MAADVRSARIHFNINEKRLLLGSRFQTKSLQLNSFQLIVGPGFCSGPDGECGEKFRRGLSLSLDAMHCIECMRRGFEAAGALLHKYASLGITSST